MKKIIAIICAALMMCTMLTGCGNTATSTNTADDNTLSVVTTIFPIYDWTQNIIGDLDGVETTLLLDNGVDLHSFQPTADDLVLISSCDVFIYVGGESDGWVSDALKDVQNKDIVIVNLMDALGNALHEEVEGVEATEEHEEGEEEIEYDEHVWLSLKNAETLSNVISDALCKADPAHRELYQAHLETYILRLAALDEDYAEAVKSASKNKLVFGDRFPFIYMMKDYGLEYTAAFSGCSTETKASFDTIITLADEIDRNELDYVMTLEGTDHSTAEQIVTNCKREGVSILSLNSLQSITAEDVENGCSYLNIMDNNLKALKKALG